MNRITVLLPLALIASATHAEEALNTAITRVYAQSQSDGNSDAHLIQIGTTISQVCSWNRLYIDFADKDLFAAALARYLVGENVSILYTTTAPSRSAGGHVTTTCRVTSIF